MTENGPAFVGGFDEARLTRFVARGGARPEDVRLSVRPLRGGLEAAVARVQAQVRIGDGRWRGSSFVVKRLDGHAAREAAIYRWLNDGAGRPAPRLLGVEEVGPDASYLYLEWVRAGQQWPWTRAETAGLVLERLAVFHASSAPLSAVVGDWDYEAELAWSAQATLEVLEGLAWHPELDSVRRALPALRRLVPALPRLRRQMLGATPGGATVIHGDAHPGNVVVRRTRGEEQVVLLDWARARLGSPLEDVSSWLQSLGLWEPEARRRHDTLLRRYLRGRGWPDRLDRTLREAHWLAGACNLLAGALRYHAWMASNAEATAAARAEAQRALHGCVRVVRRADACWRV